MASVQVLKKQGHLEAGKKKLEEFRKKKAAEKAKKNASDGPVYSSNTVSPEKQLSDYSRVLPVNSGSAGTSDVVGEAITEPSHTDNKKVSVETEIFHGSRSSIPGDATAERPASEVSFPQLSSEEIRGDDVARGPPASPPVSGPSKVNRFGSKIHKEDRSGSQVNVKYSSVAFGNGVDLYKQVIGQNFENKQNEDFLALEQHIEDLTQEKFSLQRALEASRTLADSLAAENSTLTDNYNQQGSVVNQLRSDMEKLQREIRANLMELEAVRAEYSNTLLECNAADERAKLLASEVIGLEEKAIRLRSNELKLERQLEELQAEISSLRKRISVLEKDRQDLQSTMDALQEEKKVLHPKLRKASASGKLLEVTKSTAIKQDVSTSTDDLDANEDANPGLSMSNFPANDVSSLSVLHDNRESNLSDGSLAIPPDQLRMIENISTLISELALEKEELVQALSAESSQCSKLKELNKELTRKLEVQMQRLVLLTAQNMVNDGVQARLPDSRITNDNTPYTDEGDEVVERVLGWIMKLFPGGPSRRRTSKLL